MGQAVKCVKIQLKKKKSVGLTAVFSGLILNLGPYV